MSATTAVVAEPSWSSSSASPDVTQPLMSVIGVAEEDEDEDEEGDADDAVAGTEASMGGLLPASVPGLQAAISATEASAAGVRTTQPRVTLAVIGP
jgi:hypothetical protein